MSLDLNNLKNNRDEILKAEIGSLLFNLGKTHIGIGNWKSYFPNETQQFSSYKDFYQQNYFENELNSINPQLKDFIFNTHISIDGENQKWIEYFKGDVSNSNIVKKVFFRGCENINSGIDKGSPKEQIQGKPFISNAFGSFIKDVDKKDFDDERVCFFQRFDRECQNKDWYSSPNWQDIREFVFKEIKKWYQNLLSDSRMPVNDVTLYDQAYMSVTMFKASLAGMFLNTLESSSYILNPQSIKWQILGVQYDKLSLCEKALKVPHILWYRDKIRKADSEIKKIIELKYVLGNEIYKDESGIYFLVSEGVGDNVLDNSLDNINKEILQVFQEKFNNEVYPYIGLTKSSRGTMNLTYLLENAKSNFLKADYRLKALVSVPQNAVGICQVCKNRFVEHFERDKDDVLMCEICKSIKQGRIDKWLDNQSGETIWLDELADKNNRIALIGLKFELLEWLNGDLLSSLLVRKEDFNLHRINISEIIKEVKNTFSIFKNLYLNKNSNILEFYKLFDNAIKNVYTQIINKMNDILTKTHTQIENEKENLINDINSGVLSRNQIRTKKRQLNFLEQLPNLKNIYKKYIERYNAPLQYNDDGTFYILNGLNQNSLKDSITFYYFYEQIQNLLLERSIGDKWERYIKANLSDENLIDFENRKIDWKKLTDEDIEFLSTLILQFILRKNPSPARLRRVWESTEEFFKDVKEKILDTYTEQRTQESFSSKVTDFATLQVQNTVYKQYFSITDISPISWQFVIPTSKVEDFIEYLQKLYFKHFKYVNGKLPLHIGIVVQNSKFPLYIGIKALRNIRRDIKEWSEIKKEGKNLLKDLSCYEEVIEQNNQTKNYYSLYETRDNPTYPFKRLPSNNGVKLYNENDNFIIYPNTIDFEYLDTNTRRNEIYYENGKRVAKLKENRPIEWSEWENYKNFKEIFKDKQNQLQTLVSLIYSKMEDWKGDDNSFKFFMQTTFKRYEIDKSQLGIKDFSFDEMKKFLDMFEFWHTALKGEYKMGYYLIIPNWNDDINIIKEYIENNKWILNNEVSDSIYEKENILLIYKDNYIIYFGKIINHQDKTIIVDEWHEFTKPIFFNEAGIQFKSIIDVKKEQLEKYQIKKLIQDELKRENLHLKNLKLKNFTLFDNLSLEFNRNINIFVGENSTGKTHLLKLIYSILKMNNEKSISANILEDIFKVELNNLISFGKNSSQIESNLSEYSIGFRLLENRIEKDKTPNYFIDKKVIFIPAKEMLSFFEGFLGFYQYSSFDKTYYDLAEKLNLIIPRDVIYSKTEREIIKELEKLIDAKVIMKNGRFYLEKEGSKIEINQIAEGFRKIATIVYLVANRSLKNSILIIDELEANLNPKYLKEIIKIIYMLSKSGVQIFIATHSLFLLREFELLKESNEVSYFNFYFVDNKLMVNSSNSLDEVENIASLDENLYQSDRFLERLNEI